MTALLAQLRLPISATGASPARHSQEHPRTCIGVVFAAVPANSAPFRDPACEPAPRMVRLSPCPADALRSAAPPVRHR